MVNKQNIITGIDTTDEPPSRGRKEPCWRVPTRLSFLLYHKALLLMSFPSEKSQSTKTSTDE
jgi:hypothetical protein